MSSPIGFVAGILFANFVKKNAESAVRALDLTAEELGAMLVVLREHGHTQSLANVQRLQEIVANKEDAALVEDVSSHLAQIHAHAGQQHTALTNAGASAAGRPREAPYVARLRKLRERKSQERGERDEIKRMPIEAAKRELAVVNSKISRYESQGRPNARAMGKLCFRRDCLEDRINGHI
jgi:hypothetical protein